MGKLLGPVYSLGELTFALLEFLPNCPGSFSQIVLEACSTHILGIGLLHTPQLLKPLAGSQKGRERKLKQFFLEGSG